MIREEGGSVGHRGRVGAVVAAAGRGERLPGEVPKPYLRVGERSILDLTLAALEHSGLIDHITLVVDPLRKEAVANRLAGRAITVVGGGPDRQASVAAGLEALPPVEWILVHDGVRPFVSADLIRRVLEATRRWGAAVPALAVTDALKESDGRVVHGTAPRLGLYAVQTPQGFGAELLREAHRRAEGGPQATDDAELVERLGRSVAVVPGDPANIKITTPDDLALADRIAGTPGREEVRVGLGHDLHRLEPDRPLVIGGVNIPSPRGLSGHSDADVLTHAIADALLGAAGERDIGHHFPPEDPAYRGADSISLLASVAGRLGRHGWRVSNVDAVILAEAPRIGPYVDEMRRRIADAVGVESSCIGIKATTAEGLGAIGRREGIGAQAVAVLRRRH